MEDQFDKLISLAFDLGKVFISAGAAVAMATMVWRQNQAKHRREVKERLIDSSAILVSGKKVSPDQEMRIIFNLMEYTDRPCSLQTYKRMLKSPFKPCDLEHFRKAGDLIMLTYDDRIIEGVIGWRGILWRRGISFWQFLLSLSLAAGGAYFSLSITPTKEILAKVSVEAILASQIYIFAASVFFASSGMLNTLRRVERMRSLSILLKRTKKA